MTLRELCAQVRGKKEKGQIGKNQLLSAKEREIASYATTLGSGTIPVSIRVFESGYVLYEEDEKHTVFHLDDVCGKDMEYDSVDKQGTSRRSRVVPGEVYMSADCTLRLILEGNDRVMHNREKVESDHVEFSYSGIAEDMPQLGYTPDFFRWIEEEIDHLKMLDLLRRLEMEIRPVQWNVYVMIERDGKRQKDIASMLGITQQAVSKDYRMARKAIESLRELLWEEYYGD